MMENDTLCQCGREAIDGICVGCNKLVDECDCEPLEEPLMEEPETIEEEPLE